MATDGFYVLRPDVRWLRVGSAQKGVTVIAVDAQGTWWGIANEQLVRWKNQAWQPCLSTVKRFVEINRVLFLDTHDGFTVPQCSQKESQSTPQTTVDIGGLHLQKGAVYYQGRLLEGPNSQGLHRVILEKGALWLHNEQGVWQCARECTLLKDIVDHGKIRDHHWLRDRSGRLWKSTGTDPLVQPINEPPKAMVYTLLKPISIYSPFQWQKTSYFYSWLKERWMLQK